MHLAIEVGEFEIWRLQRREIGATRRRGFAEIPHAVDVILDDRLAEVTCECGEIERAAIVANEFRSRAQAVSECIRLRYMRLPA